MTEPADLEYQARVDTYLASLAAAGHGRPAWGAARWAAGDQRGPYVPGSGHLDLRDGCLSDVTAGDPILIGQWHETITTRHTAHDVATGAADAEEATQPVTFEAELDDLPTVLKALLAMNLG